MKIIESKRVEETRILKILREQYEADGYIFYEYPSSNILPETLRKYRVDAIAMGDDDNILIEVVFKKSKEKSAQLEGLAEKIKELSRWKLRAIYAEGIDAKKLQSRTKLSYKVINTAIVRAEELVENEFWNEGFLLQWSILEAIYFHLSESSDVEKIGIPTVRSIISSLEHEGHVSFRDAKSLRKLFDKRNMLTHGQFNFEVTFKEYSKLDGIVRSLYSEILEE